MTLLDDSDTEIIQGVVNLSSVWHASGIDYPEYLCFGDPHENYYKGDIEFTEITMPVITGHATPFVGAYA